jgi:hypothetical protein
LVIGYWFLVFGFWLLARLLAGAMQSARGFWLLVLGLW